VAARSNNANGGSATSAVMLSHMLQHSVPLTIHAVCDRELVSDRYANFWNH